MLENGKVPTIWWPTAANIKYLSGCKYVADSKASPRIYASSLQVLYLALAQPSYLEPRVHTAWDLTGRNAVRQLQA